MCIASTITSHPVPRTRELPVRTRLKIADWPPGVSPSGLISFLMSSEDTTSRGCSPDHFDLPAPEGPIVSVMVFLQRGQFQPAIFAVQRVPMRFGKLRNPLRLNDVTMSDLIPGPGRDLHQIGLLPGQRCFVNSLKSWNCKANPRQLALADNMSAEGRLTCSVMPPADKPCHCQGLRYHRLPGCCPHRLQQRWPSFPDASRRLHCRRSLNRGPPSRHRR